MWMMSGIGQNIFDNTASPFPAALILLHYYFDTKPGFYVFPVLAVHGKYLPYQEHTPLEKVGSTGFSRKASAAEAFRLKPVLPTFSIIFRASPLT